MGETLFDLRRKLVEIQGENLGGELAEELVTQSVRMLPPGANFLDLRNGILAANEARRDPAVEDAIWDVFAQRGMGNDARASTAGDFGDPSPGFGKPPSSVQVQ